MCLITTKQQQSRGTCWHDYLCDVCVCVARTPSNGGDVDAPSFACAHVNLKGLCSFFFYSLHAQRRILYILSKIRFYHIFAKHILDF